MCAGLFSIYSDSYCILFFNTTLFNNSYAFRRCLKLLDCPFNQDYEEYSLNFLLKGTVSQDGGWKKAMEW
jgi:hypothetical protein